MTNAERIEIAKAAVAEALLLNEAVTVDPSSMEVVGSTYIKDRADSDVDILVLVKRGELLPDLNTLAFSGWAYGGSVGLGNDSWMSWKRVVNGVEVNMLLTNRADYFKLWLDAAEVCRFLHLQGYRLWYT